MGCLSSSIVTILRWPGAGAGCRNEDMMPHDKISAAARRRMADTGEPYAAARRAVIRERQAGAGAGAGDGAGDGLYLSPGGLRSATASAAWTG